MNASVRSWVALAGLGVLLAFPTPVAAGFIITNNANINLANSQVEVGGDTSDNPNVVNGPVGSLLSYTASSQFGFLSATYGVTNLNDGDIGVGVPSDGTYAIPLENASGTGGTLTLTFAGSQTIGSIAIYNGYNNRDDGTYLIRDAANNTLGGYTISGEPVMFGTNNGVDSFWLTFKTPVTTTAFTLTYDVTGGDNNTASFREIQVFGATTVVAPVPSSLVLASLGVLSMFGYRVRWRKQKN